ncbi:hypothetical protein ACN6AT_39335 (plasmid) [Streptomyces sp. JL4002]|uniref:hypothetical protein n=1 Tax=Streptomyces sp. JL4002 TaxID=3404781 RepID=UPI003B28A8A6
MPPRYTTGPDAILGGLDIILSLTPEETELLGADARQLSATFHDLLLTLTHLRREGLLTPEETEDREVIAEYYRESLVALARTLQPRLAGTVDAAIRAHAERGGTIADLTRALDVPRSTAQSRRKVVTTAPPSPWEMWAATPEKNPDTNIEESR